MGAELDAAGRCCLRAPGKKKGRTMAALSHRYRLALSARDQHSQSLSLSAFAPLAPSASCGRGAGKGALRSPVLR